MPVTGKISARTLVLAVSMAAVLIAALATSAAHAAQITLRYLKAEGTISPDGHDTWCLTYKSLTPDAELWWAPCAPAGGAPDQLFTAIQIKVTGLPGAVLAITTYVVPPPNKRFNRLCVGGKPIAAPIAALYDCTSGLNLEQAMHIYGGAGPSNRIRNLDGNWLSFWDGAGPAPWLPKGQRSPLRRAAVQAVRFNGELTGGGWEDVEGSPPQWAAALVRLAA
jgi:hypothetical protein